MGEADDAPAGVFAITAPGRQRKRAADGVEVDGLEERRLLDRAQDVVLLPGRQRRKARRSLLLPGGAPVQIGDSVGVLLLLAGVERGECAVDEIEDACLARAWPAVHRRQDA